MTKTEYLHRCKKVIQLDISRKDFFNKAVMVDEKYRKEVNSLLEYAYNKLYPTKRRKK